VSEWQDEPFVELDVGQPVADQGLHLRAHHADHVLDEVRSRRIGGVRLAGPVAHLPMKKRLDRRQIVHLDLDRLSVRLLHLHLREGVLETVYRMGEDAPPAPGWPTLCRCCAYVCDDATRGAESTRSKGHAMKSTVRVNICIHMKPAA
jgi:hypothetical protein